MVNISDDLIKKRRLREHLAPKGDNNRQPSVKDSNGNVVDVDNKITSELTVVDVGDSPNSQTGDPLRTAFIKLNNIVEALYQTSEALDSELVRIETRGAFLGVYDSENELPTDLVSDGNLAVFNKELKYDSREEFAAAHSYINADTLPYINGAAILPAGSIIKWNLTNTEYDVIFYPSGDKTSFDFGESLSNYSQGTADANLTADEQKNIYSEYMKTKAGANKSTDIKARNVNDAMVEMHLRFSQRGFDSGYYG